MARRELIILFFISVVVVIFYQYQGILEIQNEEDDTNLHNNGTSTNDDKEDLNIGQAEDEPEIVLSFNIMPVKFGSVKPPLFFSQYFENNTIRPEPIQLNGVFKLGLVPIIEDDSVNIDNEVSRVEQGYVFVDSNKNEYIILSDRDEPIYSPPNPSIEMGMISINEVALDSELYVEGYWFNHTIGDTKFRILRPYWIGDASLYQLVEKARKAMIDELGEEIVKSNFVLFPSFYGYQVYPNPDSYWNYALMFNYLILLRVHRKLLNLFPLSSFLGV